MSDNKAEWAGITSIVSVECDRLDRIDAFRRKAHAEPQVLHLCCIAGDADVAMIVVAKDKADDETVTRRFFFSDTNARKFRTLITVSTEKATPEYPILSAEVSPLPTNARRLSRHSSEPS